MCKECKNTKKSANWQGWKVDWQVIKQHLTEEAQGILQRDHICHNCKRKMMNEVERLMNEGIINSPYKDWRRCKS